MKPNYRTITTVILSAALLIAVLDAAGVFKKGEIILNSAADDRQVEVYIVGGVAVPGIYTVEKGCILDDLVRKAGGLTDDVDRENINLAYRIDKNMMIKVYSGAAVAMDDEAGIGIFDEGLSGLMIDINEAGIEELILIPGIGEALARAITGYRDMNGRFGSIEDIMNVAGIKQAKFDSIKDYICVK